MTRRFAMRMTKTDIIPFEIVEWRSERHALIRDMVCDRDPNWKPLRLGGIVANLEDQRDEFRQPPVWSISSDPQAPWLSIRRRSGDRWVDAFGNWYKLGDQPVRFCDFNLRRI